MQVDARTSGIIHAARSHRRERKGSDNTAAAIQPRTQRLIVGNRRQRP